MVKIPLANFEPDKSRFNGGALASTMNVLPVADGWAPMPDYVVVTTVETSGLTGSKTLPESSLGAYYVRTAAGTERIFVFCATRIYEFDKTELTWVDVGRVADYSAVDPWSVVLFGSTLIAQNGVDTEQSMDIDSGTIFADNSSAPIAKYLAVVGDFVVRGSIASFPNRLQWSALNDYTSNTAGVDGSDYQNFPEGEEVVGIVPMSFGAVVILKSACFTMNFALSSEYVFTFNPLTKTRGSSAPYSIINLNQDDFIAYYNDGFFRGPQFQPIGAERVDAWFVDQTDRAGRGLMYASIDPGRKIVWWKYQRTDGDYQLLGYDWQLDRWFPSDLQVQTLFKARTLGVTWEGLAATYATIDDIDVPFDSLTFDGGSYQMGCITTDGYLAYLNGSALAATIETNEIALNDTNRAFINGARLDGDAIGVTVTPYTAEYKGGTLTARSVASPSSRTRYIPMRADGRVHKFKIDVAGMADWSIISGLDVDAKASGRS